VTLTIADAPLALAPELASAMRETTPGERSFNGAGAALHSAAAHR
jgi:hypothetical protein